LYIYAFNTYSGHTCYYCNSNIPTTPEFHAVRCSTTFGRLTLNAKGVANKLFLTLLFSDPNISVLLLKDVGQIRSCMLCCKCGPQLSWCGDTNRKDCYRWRCQRILLLPHALLPRQSGTVHGFSREFNEDFVTHVRRRSLIRTRSRARSGMWRHSSILTIGWGTTSITWPTTCLQRCADPTTWTTSPSSSGSLQPQINCRNRGLERHSSPPLWSCRYISLRRPTPHFSQVANHNTSVWDSTSPRMTCCPARTRR